MSLIVAVLHLGQAQPSQTSTLNWGMLSVVISVISLLVAVVIGIVQIKAAQRPKKDIKCFIISNAPLLKVDSRYKNHLQISFQGQVIQDATSIILRVYNSGNLPVTPSDFVRPITFLFTSNTEILTAEILKTEPKNLEAKLSSITRDTIELQPVLMNSDDSIDISIIVASFNNEITVDGRILDVKMVKLEKEPKITKSRIEVDLNLFIFMLVLPLINLVLTVYLGVNLFVFIQKIYGK